MTNLIDLLQWVNQKIADEKAAAVRRAELGSRNGIYRAHEMMRSERCKGVVDGLELVGNEIERRINEIDASLEAEENRRKSK